MISNFDDRITFYPDLEIMEVDFSYYTFSTSVEVNMFYDLAEQRIAESGEDKWFFLVNYSHTRILADAWFAYSHRGKELNLAYSQGTVRFDISAETHAEIERRANTQEFDANLFTNRVSAVNLISKIPSQRRKVTVYEPSYSTEEIARRLSFQDDLQIMDVDFTDFIFHHPGDVNAFYDYCEEQVARKGGKWYFLVDYNNCQIFPEAWVSYAKRGKALNASSSLGSVRYAAGSETEQDIRMRAESQGFRPNLRNTREEALERIEEIKREATESKQ